MGTIKIKNLTFKYDNMEKNIFNACNLNIDEHWKLGLIGRNGRGKTTFLRLLLGDLRYQGTIQTNLKFDYFPQTVVTPQYSVKEVLQQITQLDDSEFWRLELELEKLRLPTVILTMAFKNLSPGQRTKSLLAAAFVAQTAFQLIDEPTNHLDSRGRQVVSQYLKTKQGFILTSHDQGFIDQSVDHILAIDRNKIQLFHGNYTTWQQEFAKQNQTEKLEKQQLNHQIKHLQQNATKIRQWSERAEKEKRKNFHQREEHADINRGFLGHRAAKVMKRSNSNLKKVATKIEEKQSLLKNTEEIETLGLNYQAPYQQHVLQLEKVQVKRAGRILNQPITLDLQKNHQIALVGLNGSGKTTLLKAILGCKKLIARGTIVKKNSLRFSYLPQQFENLTGSLADYARKSRIDYPDLLNTLHKLGVERATFNNRLENLSRGQNRKVSLARSLCEAANFYLWDEPLNYLDAFTRQQLQTLILTSQPTMILIDHDQAFIDQVASQKIIVNGL